MNSKFNDSENYLENKQIFMLKKMELQDKMIDNLKDKIELQDKIIKLRDETIDNLNKKIEQIENHQLIIKDTNKDTNKDTYIKSLEEYNDLLKKNVVVLKKHYEYDEYIVGDFFLDELENNEYIVFLLNKFRFYNYERMVDYSESNNYELEFESYKDFIEFNKNKFAEMSSNKKNFLLKLASKIKNKDICISSNVDFIIWHSNVFYINQNNKICINHPR